MSGIRVILVLVVTLAARVLVCAHDPGLSSAHIVRSEKDLDVQLSFAWTDLSVLAGSNAGKARPDNPTLDAIAPGLIKAADGMVHVFFGNKAVAPLRSTMMAGTSSPAEVVINLHWKEPGGDAGRLEFPVLAHTPFGHRMMVTVGTDPEPVALLDSKHSMWEMPRLAETAVEATREKAGSSPASWFSFVMLGVEHILTGFDHLCFLLALLLVAPSLRDVLTVVTTFTVAHSLTLAAAAMGAVSLSPAIVEPLIAASIVYVGLENLFFRRQPRYRLVLVFGFGLIHGLGFASGLAERLPGITGLAVVPPLLGFNLGVEAGQLAVAACLVPLIALARRRNDFSPRLQPACSFVIASAGFVWLLQRV